MMIDAEILQARFVSFEPLPWDQGRVALWASMVGAKRDKCGVTGRLLGASVK